MPQVSKRSDPQMATETERVIAGMLCENTGKHFLDSGMANGRMWQRNQRFVELAKANPDILDEVDAFKSQPAIQWDSGGYVVLDIFHYLTGDDSSSGSTRLTYRDDLTERFRRWVGLDYLAGGDRSRCYNHMGHVSEWLELLVAKDWAEEHPEFTGWRYTYNDQTSLSQDVQYVFCTLQFPMLDDGFPVEVVIMSIHNGADARGGFTDYRIFEADAWEFGNDTDDWYAHCDQCETHPATPDTTLFDQKPYVHESWGGWYHRHDEWTDPDGNYADSDAEPIMDPRWPGGKREAIEMPDEFEQEGPICPIHLCNMTISL